MQKWRKVFYIFFFIAVIIGGFTGFIMAKYGVAEIKVLGGMDVLGLVMFTLLIIVIAAMVVEVYNIYKSKKQFGCAKSVMKPTTEPWGQRTCYIADPEGNLIEIGSFNK